MALAQDAMPMGEHPQASPAAARRPRIVVVDDDAQIVSLLEHYLAGHGFDVTALGSAAGLRRVLEDDPPDLVLLDLGLPDEDGLAVLGSLRGLWRGPVIVVTGRGETVERVVGLEVGADDYVAKPFDLRELLARIRSVLRRAQPPQAAMPPPRIRFGRFELDVGARRLTDEHRSEVAITTGDFDLLMALLQSPNRVLTRDQLMEVLHGREAGPFDRAIDVAVARLRRKLGDGHDAASMIRSVRGAGYLLAADVRHV